MQQRKTWVPSWVRSLGTVVWISDPQGRIAYFNEHAELAFGLSARQAIGRRCADIVGGMDACGGKRCKPGCSVRQAARNGRKLEPVHLNIAGRESLTHFELLVIPLRARDKTGPWLVHCALESAHTQRVESWVERLASRTPHREPVPRNFGLTQREREILDLLAHDHSLRSIADGLRELRDGAQSHATHPDQARRTLHRRGGTLIRHLGRMPGRAMLDDAGPSFHMHKERSSHPPLLSELPASSRDRWRLRNDSRNLTLC